jgi:hypothetical protein
LKHRGIRAPHNSGVKSAWDVDYPGEAAAARLGQAGVVLATFCAGDIRRFVVAFTEIAITRSTEVTKDLTIQTLRRWRINTDHFLAGTRFALRDTDVFTGSMVAAFIALIAWAGTVRYFELLDTCSAEN